MLNRHRKLPENPQNKDAIRSLEWAIKRRKIPVVPLEMETAAFRKRIDLLAQLYRTNPAKFKDKRRVRIDADNRS